MTKGFVRTQIELNGTKNIIPNFFDLTHLHNPGVAFGFLGGANPSLRLGVFLLSYILVGVFVISRIRTTSSKLELAALSLLVGGAVGNAIDRFQHGVVTDFLDFYFSSYHYPAFNLADVAICTAIGALLLNITFRKTTAHISRQLISMQYSKVNTQ
jgi:signal peptidase II